MVQTPLLSLTIRRHVISMLFSDYKFVSIRMLLEFVIRTAIEIEFTRTLQTTQLM